MAKKDKWITPDNYHFQDMLDNGRCLYCGELATTQTVQGHKCCEDCKPIIESLVKKLSQTVTY